MVRVQLDIADNKIHDIYRMMNDLGFETWKDFLNFCINVFGWCLKKSSEGKAIGAYDEKSDSFLEVSTPALDHARVTNISLSP
jgi:hypothetical protein